MNPRFAEPGSEFQQLVEPLLGRAAAYARAIVCNREDAEDALQEAALRGYLWLHTFDRSRSFKGWWFAIVRNCCRDLLRRRRAGPHHVAVDPADLPARPQPGSEPADDLVAALGRLAPEHREVLELRYFGDCSYRDIADALGIPQGTVMSRLHAARKSLASIYRRITQ